MNSIFPYEKSVSKKKKKGKQNGYFKKQETMKP